MVWGHINFYYFNFYNKSELIFVHFKKQCKFGKTFKLHKKNKTWKAKVPPLPSSQFPKVAIFDRILTIHLAAFCTYSMCNLCELSMLWDMWWTPRKSKSKHRNNWEIRSGHVHAYASPHAAAGPQGPPFSAPSLNSRPCLTGPPLNSQLSPSALLRTSHHWAR